MKWPARQRRGDVHESFILYLSAESLSEDSGRFQNFAAMSFEVSKAIASCKLSLEVLRLGSLRMASEGAWSFKSQF